jgi:hypothetical protein
VPISGLLLVGGGGKGCGVEMSATVVVMKGTLRWLMLV